MVPHHEMGIVLDEIAEAGADDVRVRRLAFEMNGYQGPELDQLRTWARRWSRLASHPGTAHAGTGAGTGAGPPADGPIGMPSAADLDRLRAEHGRAFDRLFLTLMIAHHDGAVAMADAEVGAGRERAVVAMAGRIARVQRSQLEAMHTLLAALGEG